jgi:hypothetical protein
MSPLQPAEREAALQLIEWSLREDLAGQVDVTSTVLIAERRVCWLAECCCPW